jgi:hypothetical protein
MSTKMKHQIEFFFVLSQNMFITYTTENKQLEKLETRKKIIFKVFHYVSLVTKLLYLRYMFKMFIWFVLCLSIYCKNNFKRLLTLMVSAGNCQWSILSTGTVVDTTATGCQSRPNSRLNNDSKFANSLIKLKNWNCKTINSRVW